MPSFQTLQVLGSGGMGDVYLARMRTPAGEDRVALKRIRRGLLTDEKVIAQFGRECRIGSVLQHTNVVSLRAHGQDGDGPYLAMEYVDGLPASKLTGSDASADDATRLKIALSIARDAAYGLAHAHSYVNESLGISGVIHRDISPENILVGRDGVAKVADFGIAKFRGGTSTTDTGSVKGKLAYMAPELFHGTDADVGTDVYAFSATVYWLLCGVAPFHGRTEAETVRAVLYTPPVRPSSLVSGIPPDLDDWVMSALEKDRTRRPKDLAGIVRILDARVNDADRSLVQAQIESTLRTAPKAVLPAWSESATKPHAEAAPPPKPRRGALWAGVALALAAGLVAVTFLVDDTKPPAAPPAPPVAPMETVDSPEKLTLSPAKEPSVPAVTETSRETENPKTEKPPAGPRTVGAREVRIPKANSQLAARTRQKEGKLRIKVMPWADIFVNGNHLGKTPMEPVTLPTGSYSVILVNNELNVRTTRAVRISGGQETTLKVDLNEPHARR